MQVLTYVSILGNTNAVYNIVCTTINSCRGVACMALDIATKTLYIVYIPTASEYIIIL